MVGSWILRWEGVKKVPRNYLLGTAFFPFLFVDSPISSTWRLLFRSNALLFWYLRISCELYCVTGSWSDWETNLSVAHSPQLTVLHLTPLGRLVEVLSSLKDGTSWRRVCTTNLHPFDSSTITKHTQHVIGLFLLTIFSVENPLHTPVYCHGKNPRRTFLPACLTGFELVTSGWGNSVRTTPLLIELHALCPPPLSFLLHGNPIGESYCQEKRSKNEEN